MHTAEPPCQLQELENAVFWNSFNLEKAKQLQKPKIEIKFAEEAEVKIPVQILGN